ncbi:hypothetical protein JCM19240_3647 [Vibrio maritimus]|uniref:Uncharacterized protein n=1 Tax=Vibrio maritimus TaxID=990268 RepID=A0A090TWG7_9VIBR|nr:hypothetical protein JCM19240_3647 [Vibrio maritimus]
MPQKFSDYSGHDASMEKHLTFEMPEQKPSSIINAFLGVI